MKIRATYRPRLMWDEHYEDDCDAPSCTVHEMERPSHSTVLGPDGEPLEYEYDPIGFDLRPRK